MIAVAEKVRRLFNRVSLHEKYQSVFSTPEGQEVLEHICDQGYMFKTTSSTNHDVMLIREGQRMMALAILRHVYRDHGEIQKQVMNQMERIHET